jgi:hypothetical protein
MTSLWADYTQPVKEKDGPATRERPGPDTEGVTSMQDQPIYRWPVRLASFLLLVLAVGVAWAIIAGMSGYTLGSPNLELTAARCFHTTKVDFVVPMWKPADPILCGQS